MEPVADCDLAAFLVAALNNNDKKSQLRNYFGCLAGALRYLHDRRIRHRDIKPANILVKGDCVYLADFGIALDWSEMTRGTTTTDTAKSPIYCAPEVARFEPKGTSSDIWSLGCVFVEMVTVLKGRCVEEMRAYFKAETENYRFHCNIEPCRQWLTDLKLLSTRDNPPIEWSLNMLAFDRNRRYTADQLLDAIRHTSTHNASHMINESFCDDCCIGDDDLLSSGSGSEGEDPWVDSEEERIADSPREPMLGAFDVERSNSLSLSEDPRTAVEEEQKPVKKEQRQTVKERQKLTLEGVQKPPDNKLVASGSADETVRLWDSATGAARHTPQGHLGWVKAVAFSPDGKLVASGSNDKTVRLWDSATGTVGN
jgi:serine/threonine protein kinase